MSQLACAQCAAQLGQHIKAGPACGLIDGQNAVWRLHSRVPFLLLGFKRLPCGGAVTEVTDETDLPYQTVYGLLRAGSPSSGLASRGHLPPLGKALLRFFLRVGAVQFLDFLEDRVLGVVRVAADLAAGSAGMPAAAQTPRNVAGVGVVPGAHTDLEAAVLLLAQGQTDLDALDGARQARQILQLGLATPAAWIWSQVRQMSAQRSS